MKRTAQPNTTIEEVAVDLRALLTNPATPAALYNALAEFVNEGVMIKDSNGESLVDRWRHSPTTILAVCLWSTGVDDLQSIAAENAATLAANGGRHAKH